MKITKSQLRKVIKEEVLQEASNQARLKELDDLIEDLKFIGLTKDLKDILTRHLREL
jgi:transcription elongation factor GreA-like protein